jgi:RNA polymerase sigma factor (sigma-70 family)
MTTRIQTDEQLIEQFLTGANEEVGDAFEALVKRHGPMVLGVCRQILRHQQDAEDAFQATFLALARKAGTIHNRKLVGCWLYEVTCRIAIRARAQTARRRLQLRTWEVEAPDAGPERDVARDELRPVLYDEVNRLPQKYAVPLLLCYLEGETNEEVARLLQWPVGTVKGRLLRARGLLRKRLSLRGLARDYFGPFLESVFRHSESNRGGMQGLGRDKREMRGPRPWCVAQ